MPKLDKKKEILNYYKFWLSICVAVFIALVGWLTTHYKNYKNLDDLILIVVASIGSVVLVYMVFFINKKIRKIIDEIGDL